MSVEFSEDQDENQFERLRIEGHVRDLKKREKKWSFWVFQEQKKENNLISNLIKANDVIKIQSIIFN